jgi:hypothetical protein
MVILRMKIEHKKIPQKVVWKPQPRQADFMVRPEYEVLYGGAAGGGKSDALLGEALRQVNKKYYRAIIFRKTYPDCTELIDRSHEIYPRAFPTAKYNDNKHCWTFPSGAKIYFGAMQHKKDRTKYQGKQYAFIGFDELTHFQWDEYSYMFSRNRCAKDSSIRCYIRATTNPGGIGHGWVKDRFITAAPPMTPIRTEMEIAGKKYIRKRIFVPSSVFDNKILLENDPNYIANLGMMPEAELRALLYGDWDSFNGQVFSEWKNDPAHYIDQKWTHVIAPFAIPKEWRRYRSFDFGYAKPFSIAWWAIDYDGRAYRYRELYGCTGTPNTGLKWHPLQIAQKIREIEDKYEKGNYINGIADPSIWDASRGESIAAAMEKAGVYWEPADNDRMSGKMQMHYRFAFDEEGLPMMYIFNTCKDFIRTMPSLVYDDLDVEDVDTAQEDHIYDEARYFAQHNPLAPRKQNKKEPKPYNPLESENKPRPYVFMNA